MKKLTITLSLILIASFTFISCNEDETTELGWKNSSTSAVNDITWAETDATWTKEDTGYAEDETTESKEVSVTTGAVDCTIDDGSDFVEATVTVGDTASNTLAIEEGSSNVYTISASNAKK